MVKVPLVSVAGWDVAEVYGGSHRFQGVALRSPDLLDFNASCLRRIKAPSLQDSAAVGRNGDCGTILVAKEGTFEDLASSETFALSHVIGTDFTFVAYPPQRNGSTEASDTSAHNAYLEAFRGL